MWACGLRGRGHPAVYAWRPLEFSERIFYFSEDIVS